MRELLPWPPEAHTEPLESPEEDLKCAFFQGLPSTNMVQGTIQHIQFADVAEGRNRRVAMDVGEKGETLERTSTLGVPFSFVFVNGMV